MNQIQKNLASEHLHKSDNNTASTTNCYNYIFLRHFHNMTLLLFVFYCILKIKLC